MYASVIKILMKGYLAISPLPPTKLKEIPDEVKKSIQINNLDYEIVIKRLHLYYDMKLVTFVMNKARNLIVQFPICIQTYTQQQPVLYQIETGPVPILDLNKMVQPYTHLQVNKPYIALNFETCISLRNQELRTCKIIDYEF